MTTPEPRTTVTLPAPDSPDLHTPAASGDNAPGHADRRHCGVFFDLPIALYSCRWSTGSGLPVVQAAGLRCLPAGALDWHMRPEQQTPRVVGASREIAAEPGRIFELIADRAAQPR